MEETEEEAEEAAAVADEEGDRDRDKDKDNYQDAEEALLRQWVGTAQRVPKAEVPGVEVELVGEGDPQDQAVKILGVAVGFQGGGGFGGGRGGGGGGRGRGGPPLEGSFSLPTLQRLLTVDCPTSTSSSPGSRKCQSR